MFPEDLKYTREHEWVRVPGSTEGSVRVGITDYAQDALGDIVFINLPEVGAELTGGAVCGELESTKSVSDLYAPISGTVVARNDDLEDHPEVVNSDPYGEGWMFELTPADPTGLDALMDAEDYGGHVEQA
ncbi:glycine cleavage system protein GcvH [Actinopolymorpha alba]|uniref:glycine cleavage system protein GcvH n=1 Tax=Actinopolymorpha alba TaxID=533267 RepID=UPI00036C3741|nr:glycine cleavage system protein GcvH [Actinopolymorpha alba]